jgi:integrase
MVTKKGDFFYIRFRPFGRAVIDVKTPARSKTEAKRIESDLLTACRSGDFSFLNPVSREVGIRMFKNRGWEIPSSLSLHFGVTEELTLKKTCELFFKYPEIEAADSKWRHKAAVFHLLKHLEPDKPLKSIWVPDLKRYQLERLNEEAAESTVNRELSTFSRIFGVMIERQLIDSNPVRLVKRLSTKSGERQVYISFQDVEKIVDKCPAWFRPIAWTAYYTGMRRGEVLDLTRKQINLSKRMITLAPEDTKEAHWKRIPIHGDLIPVLEGSLRVQCIGTDKVFLLKDEKGVRPLGLETFKNPWERACKALGLDKPWPRFHDLRHTWKTNARRSGIHPEIEQAIMGHSQRKRDVHERYGRISDQELVQAIDKMTFDHGETEILVASYRGEKKCEQVVNKKAVQKQKATLQRDLVSIIAAS